MYHDTVAIYDNVSYTSSTYCPGRSVPLISGRLAIGIFRYVKHVIGRQKLISKSAQELPLFIDEATPLRRSYVH